MIDRQQAAINMVRWRAVQQGVLFCVVGVLAACWWNSIPRRAGLIWLVALAIVFLIAQRMREVNRRKLQILTEQKYAKR